MLSPVQTAMEPFASALAAVALAMPSPHKNDRKNESNTKGGDL
jgi:hypothetical protein